MEGVRKEVMSLEAFNSMLSKTAGQPGGYKWQRKDGSWWTNHNGQIVPYHEPTHGVREIHQSPHEVDPEAVKPAHQLTMQDMNARYDSYPEIMAIDSMGLGDRERLDLRSSTRRNIYLRELFDLLSSGHKTSPEMAKIPFVADALRLRDNQGELIDAAALSQIMKDEAFKKLAPDSDKLKTITADWHEHPKRNYPKGGWKIKKENNMSDNTTTESPEVMETEEEFIAGVKKLMTPEKVAEIMVNRWRKLNDAAAKAEKVIAEKGITPESIRGKTPEEIESLYGKEVYELIDSVVRDTPERLRLNEKVKAVVAGEKGGSWF